MDKTIKKNVSFSMSVLIFLYSFVRTIVLVGKEQLGLDYNNGSIQPEISNILFWIFAAVFALVFSVAVTCIMNRNKKISELLCIILATDPVFFSAQRISDTLLIAALFFIFVINEIKPIINKTVMLVLFTLISVTILPSSAFSFANAAIVIHLVTDSEIFSDIKKFLCDAVCFAFALCSGIAANRMLSNTLPAFTQFLDSLKSFEQRDGNRFYIYLILALPVLACETVLLNNHIKKTKKSKKKGSDGDEFTGSLVILSVAVSVIGALFYSTQALCTICIIVPLIFIVLLSRKNMTASEVMSEVTDYVKSHFFTFLMIFLLYAFISFMVLFRYDYTGYLSYFTHA